ncbi:SDR family NAD(P)-dependent oxidoreductase [Streptomyces malaysiensis]|uniref:Short-chain dehydrogenase/reductase SDR n=1 Tax=Streptomyces malaysiensis TaxID=92644 RepID=A0A7X5X045_STRMQ|nr:SDR family oxidoreductase [Streptomyces malaysiensis]NIY64197.1 short-chain dehydrogenase/reductase SDR [Streptomyces malaysiensis]
MTAPLSVPDVPDHRFPGLAGETAVVVGGAGGGVGTACVALLVRSGAHVVVADRDAVRVSQLAALYPDMVTPVAVDVTTDESIDAIDRAAAAAPCALVNVVGGVTPDEVGHFLDMTPRQWQRSLDLNLTYAMRTCQVVARRMSVAGQAGALVNLSVADARQAMPWFAPYGAARSGLEALTRTMAVELGPLGIRANSVAWGLISSPRAHEGAGSDGSRERDLIPLGRRGAVAEVAATVLFLLSELGSYVTGQCVVVDGGLSLRQSHYGPHDNVPEFLESQPARARLRSTFRRITGG